VEAVTGVALLDADAEASDPTTADNTIDTAIAQVREMTRTAQFPLVVAENKDYGFQRNLYGLRAVGRSVAGICAGVLAAVLVWQLVDHAHTFQPIALIAGLVICGGLLLMWLAFPSPEHVKMAADKYTHQLLQAAVTLETAAGTKE
jgi:hypothetical protein